MNFIEYSYSAKNMDMSVNEVGINIRGMLTFSTKFCTQNKIHDYEAVKVFCDKNKYLLGVKFIKKSIPNKSLKLHSMAKSMTISIRGPLTEMGIKFIKNTRFPIYLSDNTLWVVELKDWEKC